METRPILVLIGLLVAAGALAEAYTWTDENGVVHYSDRPQPGAKQIDLPESRLSRPRPTTATVPTSGNSADEPAEPPQAFRYESIEIASPASEETLWNVEGVVRVSLAITPALKPGHQVRVYFDGTPQTVSGASFQLQEVWRGVHNLQAEVIDETGTLMIRSRPSRFYVQQNTVF
jgi:hypothetical protein